MGRNSMSREKLDDRISWLKRELADLEATPTNCLTCANKKYSANECVKHGDIPLDCLVRTDCPDWELELIPF